MGAASFRLMREQNAKKADTGNVSGATESELVKISGIGKSKAVKLGLQGISTIDDLAQSEASDLVKQEWIDAAIELI